MGEIGVSGDFGVRECSFWDVGGSHQANEGARAQQQAGAALVLADLLQCPLTRAASWGSIGWGSVRALGDPFGPGGTDGGALREHAGYRRSIGPGRTQGAIGDLWRGGATGAEGTGGSCGGCKGSLRSGGTLRL